MSTRGEKSLHDCSGPLLAYHRIYVYHMVVWLVWWAIEESDGSDHLKFSTDPRGPGWLRKVIVCSHAGTSDFGGEVLSVNQWDHKQFAHNAKIWSNSVVGVEASNS
jgi:cytosine/uracil/thiamine/allantoin permease